MRAKHLSAALLTLLLAVTATASIAQAAPHRAHSAWSAAPSRPAGDPPWTFACIKDHGTSRCNDLN